MLILRTLCIAGAIAVIQAGIPYKEINITLVDDRTGTFETEIKGALTVVKNFYASTPVKIGTDILAKGISFIPHIGPLGAVLPVVRGALAKESDFKKALMKAIPDETQRAITENDLRDIEATMETVSRNIRYLTTENNFTDQSRVSIVHNIHDNLDKIVNKFGQEQAIYRKYPLLSSSPLFGLSMLISLYDPIEEVIVPELAKRSVFSCRFYDILNEYRPLAVRDRLERVGVSWLEGLELDKVTWLAEIQGRPFNEYGYNRTNSDEIECSKVCEKKIGYDICLRDKFDNNEYWAGSIVNFHSCVIGYMELVRFRVEQAFKDPIHLVDNTCDKLIRERPKNLTGYGWLTVTIQVVNVNFKCDNDAFISVRNPCDPYVKLFIDGQQVFRTSTKENVYVANFYESHKTGRIRKTGSIKFELWDDDGSWSKDDFITSWDTNIESIVPNKLFQTYIAGRYNSLSVGAEWKAEYEEI